MSAKVTVTEVTDTTARVTVEGTAPTAKAIELLARKAVQRHTGLAQAWKLERLGRQGGRTVAVLTLD
jgi:hypothetical protein